MTRKATGKSEKTIDATAAVEPTGPAQPPKAKIAPKVKKATATSRASRATKSAPSAKVPALSLAALAMGSTPASPVEKPPVAKKPRTTKPAGATAASKPITASKITKPAKAVKTTPAAVVAEATEIVKSPAVKRASKGIRLAQNVDATKDAVRVLAAQETQAAPESRTASEDTPVAIPEIATARQPSVEPRILRSPPPPQMLARPNKRNPSRWALATISVLAIAFAGFAATQYRSPDDASAAVAMQQQPMVGPNGEPLPFGAGAYHAVDYRPYPGPAYGGRYDYRDTRNGSNRYPW